MSAPSIAERIAAAPWDRWPDQAGELAAVPLPDGWQRGRGTCWRPEAWLAVDAAEWERGTGVTATVFWATSDAWVWSVWRQAWLHRGGWRYPWLGQDPHEHGQCDTAAAAVAAAAAAVGAARAHLCELIQQRRAER